jgi:hypothetical protein
LPQLPQRKKTQSTLCNRRFSCGNLPKSLCHNFATIATTQKRKNAHTLCNRTSSIFGYLVPITTRNLARLHGSSVIRLFFACGTMFHASCHLLAVTVFHYMKSTNPPAFTAAALGHGYTITDARTGHRVGHVCTSLACWCKGTTAPRVTLYEGAHERGTNYVAALQQFIRSSVGS